MRSVSVFSIVIAIVLASNISLSQSTQVRKNIICLVDFSESIRPEMSETFIRVIRENVIAHLSQYDQLTILPIDEAAKKIPTKIVEEDISRIAFSKHTDGFTHASDSISKRLSSYLQQFSIEAEYRIREEKSRRMTLSSLTDILSAIQQARQIIENPDQTESTWQQVKRFFSGKHRLQPENILIVFSDMIQESNQINFNLPKNKPIGCSPEQISVVIDDLRSHQLLPDLQRCHVIVFGRTGYANAQIDNNEKFWMEYFQATNASLDSYGFDTRKDISSLLARLGPSAQSQPGKPYGGTSQMAVTPTLVSYSELKKTYSGTFTVGGRSQFAVLKILDFFPSGSGYSFRYRLNSGGFRKDDTGEFLKQENLLQITPQLRCSITRNKRGKIVLQTTTDSESISLYVVEK